MRAPSTGDLWSNGDAADDLILTENSFRMIDRNSPPRTIVAGGAGFIGSHLCDRLISDGHRVVCMDNLLTGDKRNISHLFFHPDFSFVELDISDAFRFEGNLDYIFHFACPASPVDYLTYPIETLRVGSYGTTNLLELAAEKSARLLFASTSEVYGDPLVHPQPESYWGNVNPIGPRSVYDESKRFSEALVSAYHRDRGVDVRIVRIFNTYGPRMRLHDGRVLPTFIRQALVGEPLSIFGDGSQTRSFCYIDDLVEGVVRLMASEETEPVNIGNPEEITIRDFADEVLELTNSISTISFHPLPTDDPKVRNPDITRAFERLGWYATIDRRTGVKNTIEYFRQAVDEHQRKSRDSAQAAPSDRAPAAHRSKVIGIEKAVDNESPDWTRRRSVDHRE